ncbi:MAG: LamG domain-containing protein [Candidatus Bathyarchaeia archaeon]
MKRSISRGMFQTGIKILVAYWLVLSLVFAMLPVVAAIHVNASYGILVSQIESLNATVMKHNIWVAQTFRLDANACITTIDLYLMKNGTITGISIGIYIWNTSVNNLGRQLHEETFTNLSENYTVIKYTFSLKIKVNNGTFYAIVLKSVGSATDSDWVGLKMSINNPYSEGQRFASANEGESWIPYPTQDLYFVLYDVKGPSVDDDLVLWLQFEENLKDSSKNGYHAQSFCTPLKFEDGISGKALYLDGINDYIGIPDEPEFSIVNNPNGMTISFWICPATVSYPTAKDGRIRFLGKGDETNEHEWCFVIYNNESERPNRISFYIHNPEGGLGNGTYFQEPISVNEWIFITAVIDGKGKLHIYKNGTYKNSSINYTCRIHPEDRNAPLTIGKRNDVCEFFMGRIDDFRIYSKALTENEISNLYNSYFLPPVQILAVTQEPEQERVMPNQSVTVRANITSQNVEVCYVSLWYRINEDVWSYSNMIHNETSRLYEGTIPEQPENTTVKYCVLVSDKINYRYIIEDKYYVYTVIPGFPTVATLLALLISLTLMLILARACAHNTLSIDRNNSYKAIYAWVECKT